MDKQKNQRIETVIAWHCYSMTSIFARSDYSFHHPGAATGLRDVQKRLATLADCYREIAKKKPRIAEGLSLALRPLPILPKPRPDFVLAIPGSAFVIPRGFGQCTEKFQNMTRKEGGTELRCQNPDCRRERK